jgi:hypothetical protein
MEEFIRCRPSDSRRLDQRRDRSGKRDHQSLLSVSRISELSMLLPDFHTDASFYFLVLQLIAENHDLQVRFRWGKNDLAIWDKYV